MKTQVKELTDNRVRLDVEVPAADVDHAFDHAIGDISRSVRVPGFRKGRAPRHMVERAIGRDTLVEEALRDHLTGWYSHAVAVAGIDPVERPTIDWSDAPIEGTPFRFTAEVEIKPAPKVRSYAGLEAVRPPDEVPEAAVDGEIERLRRSVSSVIPVERPAGRGDFVVIDYRGTIEGKPFQGSAGTDYGVELGSGDLAEEYERALVGMSAGQRREVDVPVPDDYPDAAAAGRSARFEFAMKDVKERELPPLDDDLATQVSEFDTLAELRADIVERFSEVLREQADRSFRTAVLGALAEQLETDVPEPLVNSRLRSLVRSLTQELAARGVAVDDYLRVTGTTAESLLDELRPQAVDAVRRDLALEAVVVEAGIEVTDEQLEQWVREQAAERSDDPAGEVSDLLGDPATRTALRTDLQMQRALDMVVAQARPITGEQAEARGKLWTPGKESAQASGKPSPIWTPGSGEPVVSNPAGDQIDVTYIEALALSVEPAPQAGKEGVGSSKP